MEHRLVSRSVVIPEGELYAGCWLWLGPVEDNGYAKITVRSQSRPRRPTPKWVHRVAYETFHCTTIPEGHDVDHSCRLPLCIRPNHISAIPAKENRSRGALNGAAKRRAA